MWDQLKGFAGDRLKEVGNLYNKTDEALDGWLPGGSKQSPLGRTYQENNKNPGYAVQQPKPRTQSTADPSAAAFNTDGSLTPQAQEMIKEYAPSGTTVTQNQKTPFYKALGKAYEETSYAVPFVNRINIGEGGNNLRVLAHEIGHLDGSRPSSVLGVLGRTITEPTEDLRDVPIVGPALAPLRFAGGIFRAYSDASEEEYAERVARQITGDGATGFNDSGRSVYGSNEYAGGIKAAQDAIYQIAPGAAYVLDVPYEGVKPSRYREMSGGRYE